MRIEIVVLFICIALTGCQTASRQKKAPLLLPPIPSAPPLELQEKVRRQHQHIHALVAQNEALLARIREIETSHVTAPIQETALPQQPVPVAPLTETQQAPEPVSPMVVVVPPPTPSATPPGTAPVAETAAPPEPVLTPNADGVIDLTAVLTQPKDTEANPFAVRSLPADAVREVALHIGGVIHGSTPCALVNERALQPGEAIESLTFVRADADAVLFRCGSHLLRLPISEKPTRLRLVL